MTLTPNLEWLPLKTQAFCRLPTQPHCPPFRAPATLALIRSLNRMHVCPGLLVFSSRPCSSPAPNYPVMYPYMFDHWLWCVGVGQNEPRIVVSDDSHVVNSHHCWGPANNVTSLNAELGRDAPMRLLWACTPVFVSSTTDTRAPCTYQTPNTCLLMDGQDGLTEGQGGRLSSDLKMRRGGPGLRTEQWE